MFVQVRAAPGSALTLIDIQTILATATKNLNSGSNAAPVGSGTQSARSYQLYSAITIDVLGIKIPVDGGSVKTDISGDTSASGGGSSTSGSAGGGSSSRFYFSPQQFQSPDLWVR